MDRFDEDKHFNYRRLKVWVPEHEEKIREPTHPFLNAGIFPTDNIRIKLRFKGRVLQEPQYKVVE